MRQEPIDHQRLLLGKSPICIYQHRQFEQFDVPMPADVELTEDLLEFEWVVVVVTEAGDLHLHEISILSMMICSSEKFGVGSGDMVR